MTGPASPVGEVDRLRAIDRAEQFAKSANCTPEEHNDIMTAVDAARAALSTPAQSGEDKALAGFIEAIHERTPTGQWIAVQHIPNGDWSVAHHPLPWLPGEPDTLKDDEDDIADAARRIASYCEPPARRNVYVKAKLELAALRASPPPVEAGMVMVPVEPTEAMLLAGENAGWDHGNCRPAIRAMAKSWSAMLSAALKGEGR